MMKNKIWVFVAVIALVAIVTLTVVLSLSYFKGLTFPSTNGHF